MAIRQRVPADVIQSEDSDDSSTEHDALVEELISPLLADDLEQYELMREAYGKVGTNFDISNKTLDEIFNRLLPLEIAPKRWPLAKFTFPLQRIVDSMIEWSQAAVGGSLLCVTSLRSQQTKFDMSRSTLRFCSLDT